MHSARWIITASIVFILGALSPAAFGAGKVTVEEKPDLLGGIPGPVISKDGKPVPVMVMPVSVTIPPEAKLSADQAAALRKYAWTSLDAQADASGKVVKVPAPDGAETDEIIQKTMANAAGMLSAEEFKKVKAFKLPEQFLYGHISITIEEQEELQGLRVKKTIVYHADAQIRLVETANFTYQPALATGKGATMEAAIQAGIKNALDKYRLSEDEKPKATGGGGGFFM